MNGAAGSAACGTKAGAAPPGPSPPSASPRTGESCVQGGWAGYGCLVGRGRQVESRKKRKGVRREGRKCL